METLQLGKNGQLGRELQRSQTPLGELIALDRHCQDFCGDLTNLHGLAATVQAERPNSIINATAYTAVDKAESEPELARTINALAPDILAQEAQEAQKPGAWLVHYSTDDVFDGIGSQPWLETDTPAPLKVYGQTKRKGEQLIATFCSRHLIFRTSRIYAARGCNFAQTILRLAHERERLTVIDHQFGAPTGTELLADVTAHAIRQVMGLQQSHPEPAGIYHLAGSSDTTWNRYAKQVIAQSARAQPALKS